MRQEIIIFIDETRIFIFIYETIILIFIYETDTFATFPSNLMEAAFGRLHNRRGEPPPVVESIKLDGNVANVSVS